MPVIKDELDVKQKSMFLKYEAGDLGNMLILKSHLYQIDSHFLKTVSRSVACKEEECMYCAAGYPVNTEYNYFADLNGQIGVINVKGSVFFAIQKIAKAQKKDPRQMSWTVIKKGDGLATEYTTSKDDNLAQEDFDTIEENLEANTDKLSGIMEKREEELGANYVQYLDKIKGQDSPKKRTATTAAIEESEGTDNPDEVNPDHIPF